MVQPDEMVSAVRAALERSPQLSGHSSRIALQVRDGVLVMSGEVENIIAKRLAHRAAVDSLGVNRVMDNLRVTPGERCSDAQIAGFLDGLLMQESAFRDYRIEVVAAAGPQPAPVWCGRLIPDLGHFLIAIILAKPVGKSKIT